MDKIKQIDRNYIDFEDYLFIINKDIERIMIYLSYFNDLKKYKLLSKFDQLKRLISNKIENNIVNYKNDEIIISDNYVMLNLYNNKNIIEINESMDIVIDNENIILIKRNMKEFYFYNRKIVYELNEGDFISKKAESLWNTEHYKIEDNNILFDNQNFDIDELLNQKIYMKGSKM